MRKEEEQHQREDHHAKDLEYNARVVDEGNEPHAKDIQQSRAGQDEGADCHLCLRVVRDVQAQVVEKRNEDDRDCHVDRGDGEDPREEIDPTREPGVVPVRQVLRPLVDRAGDGKMRADLGEVESDDELTQGDERPAPDEGRAAKADAQGVESEDAGRRRDVRESDGEA